MVIRYDPVTQLTPRTDSHLALNVDVAATVGQATGVATPGTEGVSLLGLAGGNDPGSWRRGFLLEHLYDGKAPPTYCGVRTEQYKYVKYSTGEVELYDLATDPYELQSQHANPAYDAIEAQLRTDMVGLCNPAPPGFTP